MFLILKSLFPVSNSTLTYLTAFWASLHECLLPFKCCYLKVNFFFPSSLSPSDHFLILIFLSHLFHCLCNSCPDFNCWNPEGPRVGCSERTALKQVYYQGWNRSPAQVGCMWQVLRAGALGRPRGIGLRGRWEGGLGWGIHVTPWLIHVNVWQKPLQYCKVISLQLIKINGKKKEILKAQILPPPWSLPWYFQCKMILPSHELSSSHSVFAILTWLTVTSRLLL